jgi:hypothetical protein
MRYSTYALYALQALRGHLEDAACHGCLYLAEVSCERMNRMLDRALVVPIIDQPSELAFFGDVP